MPITSTIPGAASALAGYMRTVAAANPALNPGVYVAGIPTASIRNNWMMVGNWPEGIIVAPDTYRWAAIPGQALLRSEEYALQGCISAWSGAADSNAALARIGDAFNLLNGLHEQIASDLGGSGTLSPSGSWGDLDVTMEHNGPLGGKGWGVILGFELHVINAQLQG